ncbi:MAG: hypothetical protein OER22_05270 [Gammaproteobacteria bacterium]|nr:hypothetical protein [Gammaproteobacteria bacterium]MDH3372031.1 hypothetical protein [Gammaproteobacteria bacterium]MDH3407828.1 hypothetical protein [Gammaproteobacteria bacterium]MDH3552007.1 hypothetical protein [Gammaproteobacteria bacterium]
MSQHWATISEAGVATGLRIMVWIYTHLGRVVFSIILFPVMVYFFVRRRVARNASRDYLRRVKREYPDRLRGAPDLWMSLRHFLAFGESLLDKYIALVEPPGDIDMNPDERQLVVSVVESGKGVLLIGSHFGNLEYSRGIADRHPDLVINILIYDQHAANFAKILDSSRPEARLNLIQVTDLNLDLAIRLKEKVGRGEWLLIAGDRVPVGEGDNVCAATFFGDSADFPIGPHVLASLLRCPVYLMHCYRKDRDYHLGMELFAEEIGPSRVGKRRTYKREVQKFATALEQQVRLAPLQWFNFYDFWGERSIPQLQTASLRDHDQD